jgi:hypothetical protein
MSSQQGRRRPKSTRRPEPDSFVDAVSSVRNFALYVVETATWRLTLGTACAVISRLVPLPTEDITTRGLLGLFALNFGACIGRPLDRWFAARRRKL